MLNTIRPQVLYIYDQNSRTLVGRVYLFSREKWRNLVFSCGTTAENSFSPNGFHFWSFSMYFFPASAWVRIIFSDSKFPPVLKYYRILLQSATKQFYFIFAGSTGHRKPDIIRQRHPLHYLQSDVTSLTLHTNAHVHFIVTEINSDQKGALNVQFSPPALFFWPFLEGVNSLNLFSY